MMVRAVGRWLINMWSDIAVVRVEVKIGRWLVVTRSIWRERQMGECGVT